MTMPSHSHEPGYDPGSDKTNGFAITSLVLGIVGCTAWLSLIFGFISLSQIKQRGERGRGLAIAGIVLSCLWFVGTIATFVLLRGDPSSTAAQTTTSPTPTKTEPHDLDVGDIRPGRCFNDSANGNGSGDEEVEELTIVGCNSPHDAQAMATFTFKRGPWPGQKALSKAAGAQCRHRAGKRIAHDPASRILTLSWYLPTQQGWGLTGGGDRGVLCVVTRAKEGKKLTRRVR